jgi:Domain of unknown function (DUF1707)
MSNPVSPPQPAATSRRPGGPSADMRVGDAERAEIADRLARHFSDGRLDEAEFSERLDRAMRAKTVADLSGLLSDLPGEEAPPPQQGGSRHQRKMRKVQLERERFALRHERRANRRAERQVRWRTLRWIPLLIAVLVGAVIVAHTLMHSITSWIVIGAIAFLWMRRDAAGGQHDHGTHDHGTHDHGGFGDGPDDQAGD